MKNIKENIGHVCKSMPYSCDIIFDKHADCWILECDYSNNEYNGYISNFIRFCPWCGEELKENPNV